MFDQNTLNKYAELILKKGVNIQSGQGLEIACPITEAYVAHAVAEKAYSLGASIVRVRWEDELLDKINYINASEKALAEVPKWFVASKNYLAEKGFCYIAVSAEDPAAFKDVPAEKTAAAAVARSRALKKFSETVMANGIRWCVAPAPSKAWAKQVYGDGEDSVKRLTENIEKAMRLDLPDPQAAWEEHVQNLERRAEILNGHKFALLRFENKLGTDLTIGLARDHVWLSAREKAADDVEFIANMPTEEVFTAPHAGIAEGVVKSSMPLSYNGQIIDDFYIRFKNGRVRDFYAEKGNDALKNIIGTDAGTRRLGEAALIGKNSPVAQSGTLFFNTLFDENASCHLALGKAYPTTVKNGRALNLKQLKALGANDSSEHVDFMIGTPDLKVTGIKNDGSEIPVFTDGEWCF